LVTREEVIWGYRMLLGRDPESESAIEAQLHIPDIETLRQAFLGCPEFARSKRASLHDIRPTVMELDIGLLNRYAPSASELPRYPECITNWLGLKTEVSLFGASADQLRGRIISEIPINGDGLYGGYCEYASFLTAIDQALSRSEFTAVEVGSGWGPWISSIGLVCLRQGFRQINLVGVEADAGRLRLMQKHLARNNLLDAPNIKWRLIEGAAWSSDTTLHFPIIEPMVDHGAAVSRTPTQRDYRGRELEHIPIPAYSLSTICEGLEVIDYMHWDVQGVEVEIARSAASFLNRRVRYLFIGTHSLPIEGDLVRFFYENQWDVLHYDPCHYRYDRSRPSMEGMLRRDGEIFACNPGMTVVRK